MQIDEIYSLVKLEDEAATAAALDRCTALQLELALVTLSEPVKLSFSQRMMARAFGIDVPAEINRFTKIIRETLTKKETEQELALMAHIEAGFLPQNLK